MSCPKCQEGFVLPGDPTGKIEQDFLGAYHASAPNGETSQRAIIFLTDGFGLPLNNCKIMADNLAKRLDCDVWVPDYFDGQLEHWGRASVRLNTLPLCFKLKNILLSNMQTHRQTYNPPG